MQFGVKWRRPRLVDQTKAFGRAKYAIWLLPCTMSSNIVRERVALLWKDPSIATLRRFHARACLSAPWCSPQVSWRSHFYETFFSPPAAIYLDFEPLYTSFLLVFYIFSYCFRFRTSSHHSKCGWETKVYYFLVWVSRFSLCPINL